jgi:predicted alpha/beta superfamily hydrolase
VKHALARLGPSLLLALILPASAASQADGDPLTLGTYRVLHSGVLGEDRVLQVHLPRGYDSGGLSYPVVYVFYSDWVEGYFAQLVNDLDLLSEDRMPPSILVGVPNVQRYRDLVPWPRAGDRPGEGHAEAFLRFVREELIPWVDAEYRTKRYRVMVGPQAAAVFGVYTLLQAPGTFQAFIVNDPCILDHPERSLCRELVAFSRTPAARGTFFAVGDAVGEDAREAERLEDLRGGLRAQAGEGFHWRVDLDPAWPFFLAPVEARAALLDLFADYPFPSPGEARGLHEIEAHYDSVSASHGFSVEPSDLVLTLAGNGLMDRGEHAAALEVFTRLTEVYPWSLNGPWGLANLHRVMGDTAAAIRYYEDCVRRDPNLTPALEWLRRLRGGGGGATRARG